MKYLLLVFLCPALAYAASQSCYSHLQSLRGDGILGTWRGFNSYNASRCTARFGRFKEEAHDQVYELIKDHLRHSLELDLMAAHFNSDVQHRLGFSKFLSGMANQVWGDAIGLVKYVNQRGWTLPSNTIAIEKITRAGLQGWSEVEAIGKTLDALHHMADRVHAIHAESQDAALIAFLERNFAQQHAERIRELSGMLAIMAPMMAEDTGRDMSLFMIDQSLL